MSRKLDDVERIVDLPFILLAAGIGPAYTTYHLLSLNPEAVLIGAGVTLVSFLYIEEKNKPDQEKSGKESFKSLDEIELEIV